MDNVSLLAAFVGGVLSFISPCVLPLVPGYLSFVSGLSLDQMTGAPAAAGRAAAPAAGAHRRRVFVSSLAFVLGFSLVFVTLGASATALGQLVGSHLRLLGQVAGALIIVFGLHTMGLLRISWLYRDTRMQTQRTPAGPLGALLVGVAFAFGWTPCIGPILAAILAIAGAQDSVAQGVTLLAVYSLGLGVPFLATALAVDRFFAAFKRVKRYYRAIEIVSGALLVLIGALIFTNRFTLIAQWLTPYLPTF